MENIAGNNPVSGKNFFGRERFVKHLFSLLKKGNSFLLLGIRRTGKSSVIEEIKRRIIEEDEIEVVYLNCQRYKGIEELYKELFLSLPRDLGERLSRYLSSTKKIPKKIIDVISDHVEEVKVAGSGVKLRNDIIDYADPLRTEISRFFSKEKKRIILLIDELPFLIEKISQSNKDNVLHEIESILITLRDWRNSKVAMSVCGSLNLHQQLEELGISRKLLAGLITQQLPVFTKAEAEGLLQKLNESYEVNLSDEIIEQILSLLPDYVPLFIQYFFHVIQIYEGQITADVIEELYKEEVYPQLDRDFIYQFQERLKVFKGNDLATARSILSYIAKNQPISTNNILEIVKEANTYEILMKLKVYEFLTTNSDLKYHFSLNLIKDEWKNLNR